MKLMANETVQVSFSQIQPSNFRCGYVVEGIDGEQYQILDAEGGIATLRPLSPDERNKAEYMQGRVSI